MHFAPAMRRILCGLVWMSAFRLYAVENQNVTKNWGRFDVSWDSAQELMTVKDALQGRKVIWGGIKFPQMLRAAAAKDQIDFARGCFVFKEKDRKDCGDAKLVDFRVDSDRMTWTGSWANCQDRFSFSISPTRELDQLEFQFNFNAPSQLNRLKVKFSSFGAEDFYGFGHQFSHVNMKGRRLPIWSMEQGIGRGQQPLSSFLSLPGVGGGCQGDWFSTYTAVPFMLYPQGQGLFLNNQEYLEFDLTQKGEVAVEVWGKAVRGRLIASSGAAETLASLTKLSGRMGDLPEWSQKGAILRVTGGSEKVRAMAEKLKSTHIPVAALWIEDWAGERKTAFGKRMWWNWETDRELYPDWEQLVEELRRQDFRVMIYFNPFLTDAADKPLVRRNLFREAREKGFLIRKENNEIYEIGNGGFSAALIDLTHADARKFIKDIMKEQIALGVSGWMADFGEALATDSINKANRNAYTYHNVYPYEWAQLNKEAIQEVGAESEVLFFNRSGNLWSPGQTKAFWLGDQNTSWDGYDGIKTIVPALLSGGLSGYSVAHIDGGGWLSLNFPFVSFRRDKEMFLRWIELAALTPLLRIHNTNRPDINWQIDSDEDTLRRFGQLSQLFVALAPYRKTVLNEAKETGLPVIRHMFLDDPTDKTLRNLEQQYMLGMDLIFAPVLDPGAKEMTLRLPRGLWRHVWTRGVYGDVGKSIDLKVAAPLGLPALFTRVNSGGEALIELGLKETGLFQPWQARKR